MSPHTRSPLTSFFVVSFSSTSLYSQTFSLFNSSCLISLSISTQYPIFSTDWLLATAAFHSIVWPCTYPFYFNVLKLIDPAFSNIFKARFQWFSALSKRKFLSLVVSNLIIGVGNMAYGSKVGVCVCVGVCSSVLLPVWLKVPWQQELPILLLKWPPQNVVENWSWTRDIWLNYHAKC